MATEPEEGQQYLVGRRQVPFGFGWLKEGQLPFNELPIRINRSAYREFTRNPDLSDADFRLVLGKELFGAAATPEAIASALELQELFAIERTWSQPAPLLSPARIQAMKDANQLTDQKRVEYRAALDRFREIEHRHAGKAAAFAELHRVAKCVTDLWTGNNEKLLAPVE